MHTETLSQTLARLLQGHGITELYTVPGDFVLPWLQALELQGASACSLRLIQLSHEPSAVFAADAAARWSNSPAAVMLTYGAGALNAVNAIAQAYMEYVPLFVFAGYPSQAEVDSGLLLHHQISDLDAQRRILAEVTCAQCRLDNPATAATDLAQIMALAKSASRPVLIELPRDMAKVAVEHRTHSSEANTGAIGNNAVSKTVDGQSSKSAEKHAAELQFTSFCQTVSAQYKQPCLLVGVKAKRFGFDLAVTELAQHSGMPALTTLLGRGVLDISAVWYKGVYSGGKEDAGLPWLLQADLLICAGVIRSDSNFAAHPHLLAGRAVLWVNEQQSILPDGSLVELPACQVLTLLQQAFGDASDAALPSVDARVLESATATVQSERAAKPQQSPCWRSDTLVRRLHHLLSQQSQLYPFVVDIGDCLFAALSAEPSMLLAPAFYASMGFAVPAALGVQLSSGLRPIVLVGDGAFQMTGLELGHCQRYGLNPIVIVLNNQSWGMIKAFAPELNATALGGWQYAALGRSMGCGASQIWNEQQFDGALADALADTRRPRLIEVMLPQHSYSDKLASFQRGLCATS